MNILPEEYKNHSICLSKRKEILESSKNQSNCKVTSRSGECMCEYIVPNVRCADDGLAVLGAFSVLGYPVSSPVWELKHKIIERT